ncbi:MAG: acyltransferase [Bacteroidota bacterium]|nr:acyltransferase [Bacteroidota bacterium]
MPTLKAFKIINSTDRISSVDIFRSLAIVSVVLFHFNNQLPFGFLGVDLFFLVSGLLVGGLLTKEFNNGNRINFFKFFLQRGFKIWPSYYAFILFGSIISIYLYSTTNPDQIIPFWDLKRYLFFYQNYTGSPFHWSFDHLWSLCVEEHFYVMLPILFLIIQYFIQDKLRTKALFMFIVFTIIAGIVLKHFSYFFTTSKDTYSATHNRIDALAWGVLLNFIITYYGENLKSRKFVFLTFISGLLLFIVSLYFYINNNYVLFEKVYFHSIIPISFFLMLLGLYYINFSRLKPLRFIAYYSYNWYLWHPLFVIFITKHLGNSMVGLLTYLILTFSIAVISTVLIEEPFLEKRKIILDKIFKSKKQQLLMSEEDVKLQ